MIPVELLVPSITVLISHPRDILYLLQTINDAFEECADYYLGGSEEQDKVIYADSAFIHLIIL